MARMYDNYNEFYSNPIVIKAEVMYALQECRDRRLHHGTKFLSEILVTLKDVPPFFDYNNEDRSSVRFEFEPAFSNMEDYVVYCKARAYFDLEDYPGYLDMYNESIYERTNIFDSYKPLNMPKFMELLNELLILNVYGSEDEFSEEDSSASEDDSQSQLKSELDQVDQKKSAQQDNSTPKERRYSMRPRKQRIEKSTTTEKKKKRTKKAKKVEESTALSTDSGMFTWKTKRQDPYLLWLTAVMLKRIDRCDESVELLIRAIQIQPCHWGAWLELSTLIKDTQMFDKLNLRIIENNEHHWMHLLFVAHVFIDFQITTRAISIYQDIMKFGHSAFQNWPYLHCQVAIAFHNMRGKREIANSIMSFSNVVKLDPYRIDNFDLLSNLMYINDDRQEIMVLCKHVASIDLNRQETLCVLGNMYSLKGDHAKSVSYFKKALKLNPFNVTAWTLLGHEYIEMKSASAAIVSYRQALKINAKDYRAWYGLGQIYEQVKLPNYALFYLAQARELRPRDYRMLVSLGEMFEHNDRLYEALVCYYKALYFDNEGAVLIRLGMFYKKYGDINNQAARDSFDVMIKKALQTAIKNKSDLELNLILCKIYLFLGQYNMDIHRYDRSINYAEKCRTLCVEMESSNHHLEVLEHVRSLINEVEIRRGSDSCPGLTPGEIKARQSEFSL